MMMKYSYFTYFASLFYEWLNHSSETEKIRPHFIIYVQLPLLHLTRLTRKFCSTCEKIDLYANFY